MRITKAVRLACDFCGKDQDEVKALVRGPRDVCICEECVALAQSVMWSPQQTPSTLADPGLPGSPGCAAGAGAPQARGFFLPAQAPGERATTEASPPHCTSMLDALDRKAS